MKKVLILALIAAAVFFGLKKVRSGKADADMWAQATDSVAR
ncbi:MAG TPA: DLW-39 family protein [Nocardioidaceae bacterium]|nr:DLW-39 family protein [Nocardioidaceae bacterium]